jgi:hypothetical protein
MAVMKHTNVTLVMIDGSKQEFLGTLGCSCGEGFVKICLVDEQINDPQPGRLMHGRRSVWGMISTSTISEILIEKIEDPG